MPLYLGSDKVKINLGGIVYNLNILSSTRSKNALLSSDGFTLRDSMGIYLIPKQYANIENELLSSDGFILKDSNNLYLIYK